MASLTLFLFVIRRRQNPLCRICNPTLVTIKICNPPRINSVICFCRLQILILICVGLQIRRNAVEHPPRRVANPYINLRRIANPPQRGRTSAATGICSIESATIVARYMCFILSNANHQSGKPKAKQFCTRYNPIY